MPAAIVMILALSLNVTACDRARHDAASSIANPRAIRFPQPSATAALKKVDFATQVRSFLEARCKPCHFAGGKMYERLPSDRPETIQMLGTKLFSRIEGEKQRQMIRDFLAQR